MILMKDAFSHFWVLPLELLFYFVFPGLCFILKRLGNKLSIVVLSGVVSIIWIYYYGIIDTNTYSFLYCLPMFLGGIIISLLKHGGIQKRWSIQYFDIVMCCMILTYLGIGNVYYNFYPEYFDKANAIIDIEFLRFAVGPLLVWMTLWSFLNHGTVRERLEKCTALIYLGDISYPFYLFHYIILGVAAKVCSVSDVSKWNVPAICLACSVALSIILHETVEKAFAKFSKKITDKLE